MRRERERGVSCVQEVENGRWEQGEQWRTKCTWWVRPERAKISHARLRHFVFVIRKKE